MKHDFPHNSPAPTPSRANYGFALFLASSTAFFVYCVWALDFDKEFAKSLSITYLPQVYWAVAIPIFLLVTIGFISFILYPAVNFLANRPFKEYLIAESNKSQPTCVPALMSLSMSQVTRKLYLEE